MSAEEKPKSVQERAEQLLKTADVIHQSNNDRRAMLDAVPDDMFASDTGLDNSSKGKGDDTGTGITADQEVAKKKKEANAQKVADLRTQLQDTHKALLTMQENANLKYRKLELHLVDLRGTLEGAKQEVSSANIEIQQLQSDKLVLEESLEKAIGKENSDWLKTTKRESLDLKEELQQVKLERDEANKEKDTMRGAMLSCSQCKPKIPNRQSSQRNVFRSGSSLWGALRGTVMGLNEEAEATPQSPLTFKSAIGSDAGTSIPPPPELFQEQSNKIKEGLEADIAAMEREMKEDVDAMKSEWMKSVRTRSSKRRKDKKSRSSSLAGEGVIGVSLDAFFAQASEGLVLEEMEEERSFFSKSRSVHTAPERRKKKKKKKRGKSSGSSDDEGEMIDEDRRNKLKSNGKTVSLRDNFRAKLLGLDDEQVAAAAVGGITEPAVFMSDNPDHFSEMQKEVAAWGGTASQTLTVL